MEHHGTGVPETVAGVLGNLIAFPQTVFTEAQEKKFARRQRLHARLDLQEKEEQLQKLESALTARSAELQKKELDLSERWDAGRIYQLPVDAIAANPHQPRREFEDLSLFSLANSIREHGILQPLTVRRCPTDETTAGNDTLPYQLIAGERRLRAAVTAGLTTVPCIIIVADNRRAAELALIENLQRENLNPFEQAGAIAALIDMHAMTQEEIARALSVSQSCIANKLRILRLTADEREIILSSHLSERHARAFLRIRDLEQRRSTVRAVARSGLNVAQTEQYIDTLLTQPVPGSASASVSDREPVTQADGAACRENEASSAAQPRRKGILRDLRLFFNTFERAVSAAREAGYDAEYTKTESAGTVTLTVSIRGGHTSEGTAASSVSDKKSFT